MKQNPHQMSRSFSNNTHLTCLSSMPKVPFSLPLGFLSNEIFGPFPEGGPFQICPFLLLLLLIPSVKASTCTLPNSCYDLQGFPTELTPRVIPCCIVRILEECGSREGPQLLLAKVKNAPGRIGIF